jgi:hypothetical protein
MEQSFMNLYNQKNVKNVKKILQYIPTYINSAEMDYEFNLACILKKLKMAKLFINLKPTIDISMNEEFVFRNSGYNSSSITIKKWLLKIKPTINISARNNEVFIYSIYLTEIKPINYYLQNKPRLYYIFEKKYNTFMTNYKIYTKKQQMAKM